MQLLLSVFSSDITLINSNAGFYEKDGIIQYLLNGLPVYAHSKDNNDAFRQAASNLIHQGLYRNVDIERAKVCLYPESGVYELAGLSFFSPEDI